VEIVAGLLRHPSPISIDGSEACEYFPYVFEEMISDWAFELDFDELQRWDTARVRAPCRSLSRRCRSTDRWTLGHTIRTTSPRS
jgi:hypothetical protein